MNITRHFAVFLLLVNAVLYTRYGVMPALTWLGFAILTARYMPKPG